jgi:sulfide:quinone oxidoreductase
VIAARQVVVLGAGTAGTVVARGLRRRLDPRTCAITVVDRDDAHQYQPGYLFIPFGTMTPAEVQRSRRRLLPDGVDLVIGEVAAIDRDARRVRLGDGRSLRYDVLVVATGVHPRPELVPGLLDHGWQSSAFEFYTLAGATALRDALARFRRGRLVVHVAEMPIKCPVAPLELAFLADDHLRRRGVRDAVELTYVTPLDAAFTKPVAAAELGHLLADRGIAVEADFMVESVDGERRVLRSYDGREIGYDLLVTVPPNAGADVVGASGLGDELACVRVDPHTLRSVADPAVFAVGDAAALPTSKAGSTAHFAAEVVVDNVVSALAGEPPTAAFDGHASCFVESGGGRALLLDFDYGTQPLPGRWPSRRLGPFRLLAESRINHLGKRAFAWTYWHLLLPGRLPTLGRDRRPATTTQEEVAAWAHRPPSTAARSTSTPRGSSPTRRSGTRPSPPPSPPASASS